ncbi:hypothetical protein Scep_000382 [Stephania cephalantha]|uniref:Uncharacterized protein n=1 Tax=Stephania cephalantha TaxID=152367 RepID=A0AAP0Q6M2_9MAGN
MDWFYPKRRGPEWKQGWTGQALSSITLPPPPLLAVFAIVVLFLSLSKYLDYRADMHNTLINFQLVLLLLPVILIFVMRSMPEDRRFSIRLPRPQHDSVHRVGRSPLGVAVLLVVLLVMISYQSSVHSHCDLELRTTSTVDGALS